MALTAQVVAAVLILYLQGVIFTEQEERISAIVRDLCNTSMRDVTVRTRQHLDGALQVFVEGVSEEIRQNDYDLNRVATELRQGLQRFPYIDRFFLWTDELPNHLADQVIFFRRTDTRGSEPFSTPRSYVHEGVSASREGREVFAATREINAKQSYVLIERDIDGADYQLVWRSFWQDWRASKGIYALVGYMVSLDRASDTIFPYLEATVLASALNPNPTLSRFELIVQDEQGAVVHGDGRLLKYSCASVPLDFRFFPEPAFGRYLLTPLPPRMWTLTLSASSESSSQALTGLWPSVVAVLLILISVFCAMMTLMHANHVARLQSDFVSNLSHQLRTPLAMLSGASQTLQRGKLSLEKRTQYIRLIGSQALRMSQLVDLILSFTITGKSARVSTKVVDMNSVVKRCVDNFRESILGMQDCRVSLELSPEPLLVRADDQSLENAILNMLDNAVKYGRSDMVNEIDVSVETQGRSVELIVRDRGTTIARSDRGRIFEKFYRGVNSQGRAQGFGLGLAIVQSVVSAHGGRVSVDSRRGGGNEFRVSLPRV